MVQNIPCVILSGGKSSRMGEDKSLLPFQNEKTLIEFQYKKLSQIFQSVYISSKIDKFDFPCNIIYDKNEIYSPMVAIKSILQNLDDEKVFIITVDVPLLKEETILELINSSFKDKFDVTICADNSKTHNLIGVFRKAILPMIDSMLEEDNHKINMLLTQKLKLQTIFFKDEAQFLNINTKDDYLAFL
ncbi:MAG: molybdenum cofactor guanylyltransferase MobA [Arcobacteraceae bacterium]|nr:molybdenum cofactor guanylyltransferase MobA [Arcobacteraceae bacterium]